MLPNLNPRELEKAMRRLGVQQIDIPATEVIIKSENKDIIIQEPTVIKVNMMGQESFQISGKVITHEKSAEIEITNEDIQTVISHTNCSEESAINTLKSTNCDIAEAILRLKK